MFLKNSVAEIIDFTTFPKTTLLRSLVLNMSETNVAKPICFTTFLNTTSQTHLTVDVFENLVVETNDCQQPYFEKRCNTNGFSNTVSKQVVKQWLKQLVRVTAIPKIVLQTRLVLHHYQTYYCYNNLFYII